MYGRTDKTAAIGLLATAGAVLGVARWLTPATRGYGTHTELGLPPCNFLRLTHLPCPSCGLTTSFAWAIRMDFWQAFLANPFGLLLFFGTVALIPVSLVLIWRRISFRRITESAPFTRAVYVATALYFISWIFKLSIFHFAGY
ncbi:MAG: DUF2752 domain-containing protein [Terracidiphilus sp.]|jgi:hypothetical protein